MKNISIAWEVIDERTRQNEKWGEQNHPNGTGPGCKPLADVTTEHYSYPAEDLATLAKLATDRAAARGDVTWRDILIEEVFEAFAEDDPAKLRAELVQVAAVAQQWVEAIDRSHAEVVKP
ncbi:hypothetical protein QN345_00575 [Cryobacterium sp. 10I1]|uniref:hypothetical protein n=2 Tax=Bacteria TaxID=2 RepID=UPI002B228787|nr:hypothetical protein [Cryobacterium sp. 10I1]MEB0303834.1 hypothetical protein [Cryobacterium sp. 10I1]